MTVALQTPARMRSTDRILVLEPMNDKKPRDVLGNLDPRLFTGENNIHAVMDLETCLWTCKYDKGSPPEELRCKFTSFKALLKLVTEHYARRNIRIKEIID